MEKIRVGLLLDSYDVEAWEYKMFENILKSYYAEIVLVVMNSPQKQTDKPLYTKMGRLHSIVLRKISELVYGKIIERRTYLPDALAKKNAQDLLRDVVVINVDPVRKKSSDYFKDEDTARIRSYGIDVLIRSGFRILRGDILKCARYGIWSFHHGDNTVNRGGPAGFWESMEKWPETGSVLQILTEDLDGGVVLYRSYSCTDEFSVKDNRSNYFWKSLSFMTRMLERLYLQGSGKFLEDINSGLDPNFYCSKLYSGPTPGEHARLVFKKAIDKIKEVVSNRFTFKQWFLLYHMGNGSSLWRYTKLVPPKDRFWADPHVVHENGKYYVFIEEYMYATKRGHISMIEMDEKGGYKEPVKVLQKPYHLSYPFVFKHEGEYYMIPETMSNKTIELYKCVDSFVRWEWQMNLMENVNAVDTTLFYYRGKWWMFTNIIENEGASCCDELFLFYSDDLFSDKWRPHFLNPVISDCKSSRPAGKIFEIGGRIYRPSQNCSVRYGYGFNINRIDELSENSYRETIVSKVEPRWDRTIMATHTYNSANGLHIIDAQMKRWR